MMPSFEQILTGGDLRSIGRSNAIIADINSQENFDQLFKLLFHTDRIVVMRAADVVEKVTIKHPQYLVSHSKEVVDLCNVAENKEFKWHLALLLSRLHLKNREFKKAWDLLALWAKDKTNSRIVRVNAIQGLFELVSQKSSFAQHLKKILSEIEIENIPSINARIKKIRKHFE